MSNNDQWFFSRWETAFNARREAAWHCLAEDLFDQVDEEGAVVTPEIRAFLHEQCLTAWPGFVGEGDVASRLLALLMETRLLDKPWETYGIFEQMVSSEDRRCRYRGVAAAWLSDDPWFIGMLAAAWQREASPCVKEFMVRAVSAMGDWGMEQRPNILRYRAQVHRMRMADTEDQEDAALDELDHLWWSVLTEDELSYINNPRSK